MGLARAFTSDQRVQDTLRELQRDLFTIAAELATDPDKYELFQEHFLPVTAEMVENLENVIDSLEQDFQMPTVCSSFPAVPPRRRPSTWPAASSAPPSAGWWPSRKRGC